MIFIVALIFALFWHLIIQKYWVANFSSAISATLLSFVLAIGTTHYDIYGDQLLNDILQSLVIAFIISVIIGSFFKLARSKHENKKI